MSDRGHWETVWQFRPFLLHKVLKEGFSGSVVGEGEVKLLLGKRFDKLFIHLPRFVG
jgi:hypothetical protein